MVTQVTKLEECGRFEDGTVFAKLRFCQLRADGSVKSSTIHRFSWAPGIDFEMSLPEIQAALLQMEEVPLSSEQIQLVREAIAAFHTPEVVALHRLQRKQKSE